MKAKPLTSAKAIGAYAMTLDEIMAEVLKSAHECGDCLVWTGHANFPRSGGKVGTPKFRNVSLRRLLYTKRTGHKVPAHRLITNTCETPACIEHLGPCTKADAATKGYANAGVRMRKTASNRRTARAQPWVKLSEEKAEYIRTSDKSCRAMAAELGVDKTLVSKVRLGKVWAPIAQSNPFAGLFSGLMREAA